MSEPILILDIPGLPVPYARSGGHGKVRFTPARQRTAMADLKKLASIDMIGRPPLATALSVHFLFQWPFPKSMSPKKRADLNNHWKTGRPDADNLIKLCADSLNGIVWADDALIVHAIVHKVYGESARTVISVKYAGVPG
jgi:Holliday junction resolvase RusA-like endonuclease